MSAEQQILDMLGYVKITGFDSPIPNMVPSWIGYRRALAPSSPAVQLEENCYRFTFSIDESTKDMPVMRLPGLLAMFLVEHFITDKVMTLTAHFNIHLAYMQRFSSTKALHLAQLQELHNTITEMKEKVEFTDASQPPVPRPARLQKNVDEVLSWLPIIEEEIQAVTTGTPLKDLVSTEGLPTGQG